jgi:prophage regulatory protein
MESQAIEKRKTPQRDLPAARLLRIDAVMRVTGLRRTWLYRLISDGRFPKPIPLGEKTRAWIADDVHAWIDERIRSAGRGFTPAAATAAA